jgi:hypothetical protein
MTSSWTVGADLPTSSAIFLIDRLRSRPSSMDLLSALVRREYVLSRSPFCLLGLFANYGHPFPAMSQGGVIAAPISMVSTTQPY